MSTNLFCPNPQFFGFIHPSAYGEGENLPTVVMVSNFRRLNSDCSFGNLSWPTESGPTWFGLTPLENQQSRAQAALSTTAAELLKLQTTVAIENFLGQRYWSKAVGQVPGGMN